MPEIEEGTGLLGWSSEDWADAAREQRGLSPRDRRALAVFDKMEYYPA